MEHPGYKGHCHKMARIAHCVVAFPYAWADDGIFGESSVHLSIDDYWLLGYIGKSLYLYKRHRIV